MIECSSDHDTNVPPSIQRAGIARSSERTIANATSRTSMIAVPDVVRGGVRNHSIRPRWVALTSGASGPNTPAGYTMTTGAPPAWRSRTARSAATLERVYPFRAEASGVSTVTRA